MKKKSTYEYSCLRKSISTYIDKYPSPNKEQNKVWLKRLSELYPFIEIDPGKKTEYYKLRETVALSNGGFAMKYVMKYYSLLNDENAIRELFQEANIGLLESIDTFDVKKQTSFTTYAYFHIRKRIIDFIKHNKTVRAPRDIARNIRHVFETQGALLANNGKTPTAKEIQRKLYEDKEITVKEDTIESILLLLDLNSAGYEDSFISEYKDQVYVEDDVDLFRDMEIHLTSLISKLDKTTQDAIKLRYGISREFPHSPEEVLLILNIDSKDIKDIG